MRASIDIVSRGCGDKRPDDVNLGTPTIVLNSATQSQLSPLFIFFQDQKPHGPHRHKHPARLARPATIMADGPAPARAMTAASDEFREIAEAAGKELKEVLQKDFGSAAKYQGFADFDIKPYETILKDVMEVFETQVDTTNATR